MMNRKPQTLLTLIAAGAAIALAACSPKEEPMLEPQAAAQPTPGQRLDQAIASTEKQAEQAGQAVQRQAEAARSAAGEMAQKVESKVEDAAITASVNAELAKDSKLSALRIDVDTVDGRVALRGKAPDAASRERATQLALAVKGVRSVDNRLELRG
jgi:osmotically-inducible protein OsmY